MSAQADTKLTSTIWACPVAFVVHDLEEILTVERWLRSHATELPQAVQPFAGITTSQFTMAVLMLLAAFLGASAYGAYQARRSRTPYVFLVVAGAFVANGVTHVAQAIYFGGYTPGVVTAMLVVLPYCYLLGKRLRASGLLSRRGWGGAIAAGLFVQVVAAFIALGVVL